MKITKFLLFGAVMSLMAACSDSKGDEPTPGTLDAVEAALQKAVVAYVDNTVLPTYSAMADAAVKLNKLCQVIKDNYEAGTLTATDVENAGIAWKQSRKSWELSEAFLFGPANTHNIDPHIDSWPLDKAAMESLLADIRNGKPWSLTNNGGYGLIGFHSLEYLLFELSADGNTSRVHSLDYTPEELEYLCAVAEDLCQQCVCLEACWAGTDNISAEKQAILEEAELDYNENYGWEMKNARQAGSRFKTYREATEEILQGCIDIADEVGNIKIGRPHIGSTEEDKNYIESPYSLNSVEDFVDNIISIRNAYCGSRSGDPSVSDYIRSKDKDIDNKVRKAIQDAIRAIEVIPEPFAKNATGTLAAEAVKATGTTLVEALEEAHDVIFIDE
ncbi:MAG: hypothetical protein K2M03_04050 [Muribaculaceae bacterium]|nr:hypothetical protein [Muribaculaceae bacterium]